MNEHDLRLLVEMSLHPSRTREVSEARQRIKDVLDSSRQRAECICSACGHRCDPDECHCPESCSLASPDWETEPHPRPGYGT